jgi:phenylpropionate dioxygenase-like ring-hydroxylating dioxygenase large terminal subunit
MNNKEVIPLDWYVDNTLLALEKQCLAHLPFYFAHGSAVANKGNYYVLPTTFNGKFLINNNNGYEIISNICRHRQSILLNGQGDTHSITCPVHSWCYNLEGDIISSHHVENPGCKGLDKTTIHEWNHFIFNDKKNISEILNKSRHLKSIEFSNFRFGSSEIKYADYNWKIFLELFLDLYHIGSIHPGLRKFADCNEVDWESASEYCSQKVKVKLPEGNHNPSQFYARYIELIKKMPFDHSYLEITWFTLFPNIMIEIYPYNIVVSVTLPISANRSVNVIEFLQDTRIAEHPEAEELYLAFKKAYLETAKEDDIASLQIQKGREALVHLQKEDYGIFQTPLENGIPIFYDYWRRNIYRQ